MTEANGAAEFRDPASFLLTLDEAAAYLKVPVGTLRDWVQNRKIRSVKVVGTVRIRPADLISAMVPREAMPPPGGPRPETRIVGGRRLFRSRPARPRRAR